MKKCYMCKIKKEFSEFHKDKTNSTGYNGMCKQCRSEYKKKYDIINSEKNKLYRNEYREKNPEKFVKPIKPIEITSVFNNQLVNKIENILNKPSSYYDQLNPIEQSYFICQDCRVTMHRKHFNLDSKASGGRGIDKICRYCYSQKSQIMKSKGINRERDKRYRDSGSYKIYRDSDKYKESSLNSRERRRRSKFNLGEDWYIDRDLTVYVYRRFNRKCFRCGSKNKLQIDHHYPLSKGFKLDKSNAVLLCRSCNSSKGSKMPYEFYNYTELERLSRYGIKTTLNGSTIKGETQLCLF